MVMWSPKVLCLRLLARYFLFFSMTHQSAIRQNYSGDCEALVNKHANMELYASYLYTSLVRGCYPTYIYRIRETQRTIDLFAYDVIYMQVVIFQTNHRLKKDKPFWKWRHLYAKLCKSTTVIGEEEEEE